jgi:hypothetical protein
MALNVMEYLLQIVDGQNIDKFAISMPELTLKIRLFSESRNRPARRSTACTELITLNESTLFDLPESVRRIGMVRPISFLAS